MMVAVIRVRCGDIESDDGDKREECHDNEEKSERSHRNS
jgi:hypothetical protein